MVKEIDGYKQEEYIKKKLDPHFKIMSEIFKRPQYSPLYRHMYHINVHIDIDPEGPTPKSLPLAVTISYDVVEVLQPAAYQDSKRMAEDLETRLGKEISLRTTYSRESD